MVELGGLMRVYFTNFEYYAEPTFERLTDAIAYGVERGFEFVVRTASVTLAYWSPLSGLHVEGF
jgi:hypothetical protein